MKNEVKILIAAIVVILIVLVGAFALSGSNTPQATATPTVTPVTATPTPVPDGSGSTATATPVPSVAPTATPVPSVTPTPMPESGVKLTEFGYWITYPPLDPQTWSTNPPPVITSGNVVYFDSTSATVDPYGGKSSANDVTVESYRETYVIRSGDMNGTVNVTIHMTMSGNVAWEVYGDADSYDYSASMHGDNLTDLGNGDYKMVFGPGVTGQELCIHVYPAKKAELAQIAPPTGWVKLTLTSADGGYSVGGNKDFTLSIVSLPHVYFEDSYGWVEGYDGYDAGGDFESVTETSTTVDVTLWIERTTTVGALPVNFGYYVDDGDVPDGAITFHPFAFANGEDEALLTVSFDKDYLSGGDNWADVYFYVDNGAGYNADYDEFQVQINYT